MKTQTHERTRPGKDLGEVYTHDVGADVPEGLSKLDTEMGSTGVQKIVEEGGTGKIDTVTPQEEGKVEISTGQSSAGDCEVENREVGERMEKEKLELSEVKKWGTQKEEEKWWSEEYPKIEVVELARQISTEVKGSDSKNEEPQIPMLEVKGVTISADLKEDGDRFELAVNDNGTIVRGKSDTEMEKLCAKYGDRLAIQNTSAIRVAT